MNFNKNKKTKVIIIASVVTLIFMIIGVFLFSKLADDNKDKLNVKKAIKTVKQEKQNKENKALTIKVVGDERNEKKLKEFADKYKDNNNNYNNNNYNKCDVNSTSEARSKNGEFYVDNASDLYTKKIVSLDDRFRIEDRLKEATNNMTKVYSETSSFKADDQQLDSYLSKGTNKSRFSYLYGITNKEELHSFISKLSFLKDSDVSCGTLNNIKIVDDNDITFQFQVKAKNNLIQVFNVALNFADERATLNIKIS